jgi:hypothetical protein
MLARDLSITAVFCLLLALPASTRGAETETRSFHGPSLRVGTLLPLGEMSNTRDSSAVGSLHVTAKYLSAGASFVSLRRSRRGEAIRGFVLDAGLRIPLGEAVGLAVGGGYWFATEESGTDWDVHAGLDAVGPGSGPVAPDFEVLYRYVLSGCSAQFLTLSVGIRFV